MGDVNEYMFPIEALHEQPLRESRDGGNGQE